MKREHVNFVSEKKAGHEKIMNSKTILIIASKTTRSTSDTRQTMDVPKSIRVATDLKQAGNQQFKAKQWDNALKIYQEALKKLNGCKSGGTCIMLSFKL